MSISGIEVLEKLVSFNTIRDNENTNIISYLEDIYNSLGFETRYKDKAMILEYGSNPKLGFVSHTDTVDVLADKWKTDPFTLTEKDGMLYGLGAVDTKSTAAAFIEALSRLDLEKLERGIMVYVTYDEEISFKGMLDILDVEKEFPEYMIIGEPTDNVIDTACKGILEIVVDFYGKRVHASNPSKGINSNYNAIQFFNELYDYYVENIVDDTEELFDVPETTLTISKIEGGDIKNAVPDHTKINIDSRISKKEHLDMLKEKLEELADKYNAKVSYGDVLYPFNNEVEILDRKHASSFITEASLIPCDHRMILGGGPVTAHEIDEHISKESFEKLVNQYMELIEKICM